MAPSNEPPSNRAPRARSCAGERRERRRRPRRPLWALALASLLASASGCGGGDETSLRQDVRLQVHHDPPASGPAGEPFLLGLRVSAEPPLPAESAHLWWSADGDWVRAPLSALAGTERMEAQVPPQPKGRVVRYYFTVLSPLGDTLRLPEQGAPRAAPRPTYELVVRAPAAPWATGLRVSAALAALAAVLAGAWAARPRREGTTVSGAALVLVPIGAAIFALGALGGAVTASVQATGSPLRDVPAAWWIALSAWTACALGALALRRRRTSAGRATRALGLLVVVAGVLGAAAALVGLLALA